MINFTSIYILPLWSMWSFLFIASMTPGPNNSMLATSVAVFSWKKTLPHACGVVFAAPLGFFLVALSLGSVQSIIPDLQIYMKIIGFIIITYFSLKIFYNAYLEYKKQYQKHTYDTVSQGDYKLAKQNMEVKPMRFYGAAIFQLVNPKLWLIAVAVSTTYLQSQIDIISQAFIIYIMAVLTAIPSVFTWMFIGKIIGDIMGTKIVLLNVLMGILMVFTIIFLYI